MSHWKEYLAAIVLLAMCAVGAKAQPLQSPGIVMKVVEQQNAYDAATSAHRIGQPFAQPFADECSKVWCTFKAPAAPDWIGSLPFWILAAWAVLMIVMERMRIKSLKKASKPIEETVRSLPD
jgi:hypothetical protein